VKTLFFEFLCTSVFDSPENPGLALAAPLLAAPLLAAPLLVAHLLAAHVAAPLSLLLLR
jgi:hypothetical protein